MEDKECFDVIGAFDVIEHIKEDEKVLANLARAIVPGGALLITVPQHRWLWSATDDYACHVRRYTRDELILKVVRAGMEVEYVSSFVSLLLPLMWLSRLRAKKEVVDPMSEFKIPSWLNAGLEGVMNFERLLLRIGVRFPVGGSLLLVARKR
jgi:SAM-dependent methyltransferase